MKALTWVVLICAALLASMYLLRQEVRRAFLPNHFNIITRGDANRQQIDVFWTSQGLTDTLQVIDKGRATNATYEASGENIFIIMYRDETLGTLRHFKTNAYNPHTYILDFYTNSDSLYYDLAISGPDANL